MLGTAAIALLCFGVTAFLIYRQASASLISASRQTMTSEATAEAPGGGRSGHRLASNDAMVEGVLAQRARGDVPDRASLAAVLASSCAPIPNGWARAPCGSPDAKRCRVRQHRGARCHRPLHELLGLAGGASRSSR